MRSTPSSTASAPTSPSSPCVQLAWPGGIALVDPLAVDLAPLAKVLAGPAVAVMHAAAPGPRGARAGVRHASRGGCSTPRSPPGSSASRRPSLAALLERRARGQLPKGDRLTDWLRRPLAARASRPTRRPTSPTCSSSTTASWRELEARGRLEWAARRVRAAAPREPAAAATRRGLAADQGGPVSSAAVPPAWRGGRGVAGAPGRRASTSRCASCCPTWRWSASPSGRPRRSTSCAASAGSTTATCAAARRSCCWRPSREGVDAPAAAAVRACRDRRCSTATCAPRSRWCRPGSASWPATSTSTPRCSPPAPTSRRSSGTSRRPVSPGGWRAELVGEPIRRLVAGRRRPRVRRQGRAGPRGALGTSPSDRPPRRSDWSEADLDTMGLAPESGRASTRAWSGASDAGVGDGSPCRRRR